jgi:hypothetical protein
MADPPHGPLGLALDSGDWGGVMGGG